MGLYITLKVSARKKTPHKEMVKPKSNQTSFKRVITFLPKKALRVVRKAHHHAITKPHTHLMNKGKVYATWHTKKHHHKVHLGIASVWAMIAIVGALGLTNIARPMTPSLNLIGAVGLEAQPLTSTYIRIILLFLTLANCHLTPRLYLIGAVRRIAITTGLSAKR
jgi:hypothetical protein